jgi:hypothetical protein
MPDSRSHDCGEFTVPPRRVAMLVLSSLLLLNAQPWLSSNSAADAVFPAPVEVTQPFASRSVDALDPLDPWLGGSSLAPLDMTGSAAPTDEAGADAAEYMNLRHKFTVSLGGALFSNFASTIKVTGNAGVGAAVDMDDLVGLAKEATAGRIDMSYAFNERHQIDFSYYDIRRSGHTAATKEDIIFGDISIPAGTAVSSAFNTRIIKLAYRYNFVAEPRTVIGASFGIHSMGMQVSMDSADLSLDESFNQELPLPLLGLHGGYALSKTWSLLADVELMQVDLGNYRGYIGDNRLVLNHDSFEHVGWGVGLNGFRIDASAEGNDLKAQMNYGYQAVMVYLRFYF